MALDTFPVSTFKAGVESPLRNAFAVVPNDAVDLAVVTRTLSFAVAGNVVVTLADMADGTSVALPVVAGSEKRWRVKRVWATGTTATGIVGLY